MEEKDIELIRDSERINIILSVIGNLISIGETYYDKNVLKNLDFLDLLLCRIFEYLKYNATYDGYEGSREDIKERSLEILKDFKHYIDGILE